MANNHSGSILSAKKIIDQCAIVAKRFSIKGAVKLQYRNLFTFPVFRYCYGGRLKR